MPTLRSSLRYLAVLAGFSVLWLGLHGAAAAFETAPGSSVWYPARGLSLALLLIGGLRYAPAPFIASLLGGVAYHLPDHPAHWIANAALITAAVSAAAWGLRRLGVSAELRLRDAIALIVIPALAALAAALGVVGVNVASGLLRPADYWDVVVQFVVGDYLGMLVVTPLALLLAAVGRPARLRRRLALLDAGLVIRRGLEALLISTIAAALLWLALVPDAGAYTAVERAHWFLLLLPLALAAIRFGPLGATVAAAALSVGVVLAARGAVHRPALADLQVLLLSFSAVSLLLSAAVADRQRSLEALAAALRREAERARHEAERARTSKARFLAATTHDLRPPFEAVRLGLETLKLHALPPEALRVLTRTESAARSLSRVLDSVLDTARLEGELRAASPRPVALGPLLAQVAQDAAFNHPRGAAAVRAVPSGLRAVTDPALLERVLRNLVANAVRASVPHGEVVVGLRRHAMSVHVEVHDTGCGIEPTHLPSIFEEFVSGSGGTGIGLSLVREIADQLGLNLTVRSKLGSGSVFRVELPLSAQAPAAPELAPTVAAVRDRVIAIALGDRLRRELLTAVLSDWNAAVVAGATTATVRHELEQLGSRADLLVVDEADESPANPGGMAEQVLELIPGARPLVDDLAAIVRRLR